MHAQKPLTEKQLEALARGREKARHSKKKITAKEQKFAEVFVETLNPSEAVRQAYEVSESSASTIANMGQENLQKPKIQELIRGLKEQFVVDSSSAYTVQKQLLKDKRTNPELKNKIANKILDRAGFAPVIQQENKSIVAKFVIKRG